MRFRGKTVLTTGASSGIAWARAVRFGQDGARLEPEETAAPIGGARADPATLAAAESGMVSGDRIAKRPDAIDMVVPNAGADPYARVSATDSGLARRLRALECQAPGEVTQRLPRKFPALMHAALAQGQSVGGS